MLVLIDNRSGFIRGASASNHPVATARQVDTAVGEPVRSYELQSRNPHRSGPGYHVWAVAFDLPDPLDGQDQALVGRVDTLRYDVGNAGIGERVFEVGQAGASPFMPSALRHDRGPQRQFRCVPPVAPMIAIAVAVSLLGCSSRVHTPYVPGSAPAVFQPIAAEAAQFEYAERGGWATVLDLEGNAPNYWIRSLEMRRPGTDGQDRAPLTARYYQGKAAGAKPLVIVLPVWGVSAYPSETMAAGLREQAAGAINVLDVDGDRMLFDWAAMGNVRSEAQFQTMLALMVERFVDMVVEIRRLVDWAETRREVDAGRIALIGFSMSAIVGSVALANEPRIDGGVLVVGGADLHEVLATCNGRIKRTRERVLERFDWSIEDFKEQLEVPLAAINPARFAGRLDPDGVLVIEAAEDNCIPESARERFWHAMGRPERISYQYGHRATFLAMTFLGGYDLQRQVYRFLDRTIAPRLVRYEAAQNDAGAR